MGFTFKTFTMLVLMFFLGTSCTNSISEMGKLVEMPMEGTLMPVVWRQWKYLFLHIFAKS